VLVFLITAITTKVCLCSYYLFRLAKFAALRKQGDFIQNVAPQNSTFDGIWDKFRPGGGTRNQNHVPGIPALKPNRTKIFYCS